MKMYYPGIADNLLGNALESAGAVWIEGPKWCGKTWTAVKKSKSFLYMQDPDTRESNILAASVKPSFLMVLTGTQLGYRPDDGIFSVPIGCLKD